VERKGDLNGSSVLCGTNGHRFVAVEVQKKMKLKQGKEENKERSQRRKKTLSSSLNLPFHS
jgi:UDP-N-acetylglucosamine:LPS N-acetylglucosamine transferase